jgi:hypothetical protein
MVFPFNKKFIPRSNDTTSLNFFNGTCTADNVIVRKEWRNLSDAEKRAFIDAEYDPISFQLQF